MVSQNKHTRKLLIGGCVWLSAMVVCATLVVAQDAAVMPAEPSAAQAPATTPAPAPAPAPEPQDAAPADEEPVQAVLSGQSIQTISFKKDMPIKDALRMLAQMYQKNIVPSAKVDGIVTVSYLYDVSFEEALQAILGTHKYEVKGNFIKVYTNEEFMQDKSRFEYVTIPLYYINAEEAKKLATPLLSEFGQLGATSPAKLDTQPGSGGDSLAISDRLVVSDYPENIQKIRQMLTDVDIKPAQVLIEVTVMKAELEENLEYGIDWNSVDGIQVNKSTQQSGLMQDGFAGAVGEGGVKGLTVGITIDNLVAHIRALEGITDVTIMANPKILALNKQAGKLIIGRQDGYRSLTNLSDGGNQTQQVEFLESGTVLEFRPFIGRDGLIRMEIRPEQSTGVITDGLPKKTTTEVITNVMVKDGQTIVLGGLFQEETNLTRNQTPLLGEIPILGELFKQVGDKSKRTELVVLITPHIIHDPEDANGAERLEDVYRLAYNARKDIHWMSRSRYAEERYNRAVREYSAGNYAAALAELNGPYAITPRNHLDAIRLRERILRETQPNQADSLERVMLKKIEKEESGKWLRR
jgi:type II secretory pathway component GspD/PulD (secretin)